MRAKTLNCLHKTGFMKTQILDNEQIQKMIRRMAREIFEKNSTEKEMVIAAIKGHGVTVARLLEEELNAITSLKISLVEIDIDKAEPGDENIGMSDPKIKLRGKCVLLVDDVLNTGRTIVYAMLPFLRAQVKTLQVAVLVDRNHTSFPVSAKYKGISLSTTLQEHVTV